MKRRAALAAVLTWTVLLCAVATITSSSNASAIVGGALDARTLGLIAALAVALTYAVATAPFLPLAGYLLAHLVGLAVVLEVMEWPQPPWAWHALPGLDALVTHGIGGGNPALVALLSGALTWELAYACTWLVVRERRVWLALGLVVGLTALTAHPDERDLAFVLLCLVGLALVLVTAEMERSLARPRRLRTGLGLRLAPLWLAPLSIVLVAGAWSAPLPTTTGWRAGTPPWSFSTGRSQFFGDLLARLGLRRAGSGLVLATISNFGGELPVGGQFTPAATPILEGRVADPSRLPYWRGAVYDSYVDGSWRMLPSSTLREPAGAALPATEDAAVAAITQTITLLQPSRTLFTAGIPVQVMAASIASIAADTARRGVLTLAPEGATLAGTYDAVSLSAPSGPVTPAPRLSPAARAIDLETPPLTPRVLALAQRLTAGQRDPYAQALALQSYLRGDSYSYNVAPPQAPAGRDPVDYFLFDSRQGFCTHFASAMVVLARASGIPARLITGYAAGSYDGAQFVVTAADAHAWPELWIAGRGWVTFEPTPSFSMPGQSGAVPAGSATRTGSGATAAGGTATSGAATTPRAASSSAATAPRSSATAIVAQGGGSGGPMPGLAAALVLFGAALMFIGGGLALSLYARPEAADLYAHMCRLAGLLRAGPRAGQTPLEWATEMAGRRPEDGPTVLEIVGLYTRQQYGGQRARQADLIAARNAWRSVRLRWLKRLLTARRL